MLQNLGVFGKSTNKVRVHVYGLVVLDNTFDIPECLWLSLGIQVHALNFCDKPLSLRHEKICVSMYVYIYMCFLQPAYDMILLLYNVIYLVKL